MLTAIAILRIIYALCWSAAIAWFAPSAWRYARGKVQPFDSVRALGCILAASNLGFAIRWLAWPDAQKVMHPEELAAWSGLYCLSSLCAVALISLSRAHRHGPV